MRCISIRRDDPNQVVLVQRDKWKSACDFYDFFHFDSIPSIPYRISTRFARQVCMDPSEFSRIFNFPSYFFVFFASCSSTLFFSVHRSRRHKQFSTVNMRDFCTPLASHYVDFCDRQWKCTHSPCKWKHIQPAIIFIR